jgi:hypothetical protein
MMFCSFSSRIGSVHTEYFKRILDETLTLDSPVFDLTETGSPLLFTLHVHARLRFIIRLISYVSMMMTGLLTTLFYLITPVIRRERRSHVFPASRSFLGYE